VRNADLGKDRGGSGKERGEQSPDNPVHSLIVSREQRRRAADHYNREI
jgi:hypothetical protein